MFTITLTCRGTGTNAALGDGPAQSVFQGALDIRIQRQNSLWCLWHTEPYRTLSLSGSPTLAPEALFIEYQIDGAITALILVQFLLMPYPVNPFLVYAAFFSGPECIDFLLHDDQWESVLKLLPNKVREEVEAVRALTKTKKLEPSNLGNEIIGQQALLLGNVDAIFFIKPRDDRQHVNFRREVLCRILIGHSEPWAHPQFNAFAKGLRLVLCGVDHIVKACLFPYDGIQYLQSCP